MSLGRPVICRRDPFYVYVSVEEASSACLEEASSASTPPRVERCRFCVYVSAEEASSKR